MHKPFAVLEDLVRSGRVKFADANAGSLDGEQRDFAIPVLPAGMADEDLFSHAMHDVKALGWSAVPLHHRPPLEIVPQNDEEDALRALEKFLKSGDIRLKGFLRKSELLFQFGDALQTGFAGASHLALLGGLLPRQLMKSHQRQSP